MVLNGLVTGVHSGADNIIATTTQYVVDIGASEEKKKKEITIFPPNGRGEARGHAGVWFWTEKGCLS